eukprot:907796-Pyramimonas_sp.AAC.1
MLVIHCSQDPKKSISSRPESQDQTLCSGCLIHPIGLFVGKRFLLSLTWIGIDIDIPFNHSSTGEWGLMGASWSTLTLSTHWLRPCDSKKKS